MPEIVIETLNIPKNQLYSTLDSLTL